MTNVDLLEKVQTTSNIGTGGPGEGYLKRDQADRFIDYVYDNTVLWEKADRRKLTARETDIQAVAVGARVLRKAYEATDTGENVQANFTKVTLRTEKLRLDWEVSTELLEDNIEEEGLDATLARLFANQTANDLEELSIHGDVDSTDPLLQTLDGWHKLAVEGGRVDTAVTGTGNAQLSRAHFNQALKLMPRRGTFRKSDLHFYASTQLVQDYLYSQSENGIVPGEVIAGTIRQSPIPTGDVGYTTLWPFGIPLTEVPMFDSNANEVAATTGLVAADSTSFLELTAPKNRIVGMHRDIQTFREFKPKKDSIEYTTYIRFGVAWHDLDTVCTITQIPVLP